MGGRTVSTHLATISWTRGSNYGTKLASFTRKEVGATDIKVFEFGLSAALIALSREIDLESVINDVLQQHHIDSVSFKPRSYDCHN